MNLLSRSLLLTAVLGCSPALYAHSGGNLLDDDTTNSAMADVTCFDDGNGEPSTLVAQTKDGSEPKAGLLLSLQLIKGNQVVSITDSVSGDADYSPLIQIDGGKGVYKMILTKTAPGQRAFELVWHCLTAKGVHTGTDIVVRQFE